MRQLTYDQQAHQSPDNPIGTLEQQGLPPNSTGDGFVRGGIAAFIEPGSVTDWRHAVAIGCVRRSRYGTWEPFRTKKGGERTIACNEGVAHASDGVHILICGFDGRWFSRSSQVVEFHIDAPYEPNWCASESGIAGPRKVRVKADKYLKDGQQIKTDKVANLLAEYASL